MSWSTLRPRWRRRNRKLKSDWSGMDPNSCRVGWLDVLISVRDRLCHALDQLAIDRCCRRTNLFGRERSSREPIMNTSALHDTAFRTDSHDSQLLGRSCDPTSVPRCRISKPGSLNRCHPGYDRYAVQDLLRCADLEIMFGS